MHFADSLRFVSEQDIRDYLDKRYGPYIGERMDSVQLARIEDMLESRSAVMRAEAWTTDDGVLHVGNISSYISLSCWFISWVW